MTRNTPLPKGALLALGLAGCGQGHDAVAPLTRHEAAILDGVEAPEQTAVAYVAHTQSQDQCSGTLVTPRIVLTAAHCAFRNDGLSTEPLAADGFRVGFGAAYDSLDFASVESVVYPRPGERLTAGERVDAGLDLVALVLSEEQTESPLGLGASFHPTTSTVLKLVGFGVSSRETGESGVKRSGDSSVVGWDRETGVLELEGNGGCLGDSGGAALNDQGEWVGLVSSVSVLDDGSPCGGRTYLHTLLNPEVDDWLRTLLGAPVPEPEQDAGTGDPDSDGSAEEQAVPDGDEQQPDATEDESALSSCNVGNRTTSGWLLMAMMTLAARRRRKR